MTAKWTDFVAGAVLTAAQLNEVLDNFQDIAIFNETQSSGTEGGGFTSGSFVKRTLNTTVVNNITGCSIASSVVTLPAGTYYFSGRAPAFNVQGNQTRIQNTTAGTTVQLGTTMYVSSNNTCIALVEGVVTITGSTNFELQHRCSLTVNTNGLGAAQSFGNSEIYSQLQIRRIA
jgi:hypothetical protein